MEEEDVKVDDGLMDRKFIVPTDDTVTHVS